jgi:UDP-N-acetylmuramyl pentapeptide phosphotransferase/UDP-N-acetylglucosamine-1-phosphate transferase
MIALLYAFAAFLLAALIVRLLWSERLARLVLDVPNERSLHVRPTPRTGGIGLMCAAAAVGLWATFAGPVIAGAGGAIAIEASTHVAAALAASLAALFLVDDVRGLAVPLRFGAQLAAAAVLVWQTGPYAWLLMPCLAVGIVWSANLYNFMDGANGLAGGMTVIGFAVYGIAAHAAGAADLALAAAIVAGSSAGFLVWNFGSAARIFLGDAGSIPLGFLAAAIGILGWRRGVWPFWFPALVFSPFAIDASLTLLQRWLRGERLSQAHKSHYYQRLVRTGWSHRRLAIAAYALMAAAATSALVLRTAHPVTVIGSLLAWGVAYAALAVAIDSRWRAYAADGGEPPQR